MPQTLSKDQVAEIQRLRYEGATNEQIIAAIPVANDSLIGVYAPSELRGGKRRVAEYIGQHPGVDFKDINFRAVNVEPHRVAGQIRDLRRAGLVTFKEGRIATMGNSHGTAAASTEKGMYDIRLTAMGERRVEASKIMDSVAAKSTPIHAAIAEKVKPSTKKVKPVTPAPGQTTAFRLLPPDQLAAKAVELNPAIAEPATTIGGLPVESIEDAAERMVSDHVPGPTIETVPLPVMPLADRMRLIETQYPILAELRKREGRIHAANRLVDQALNLYDSADLTAEAIALLEHLRKTEVKFTPIESELMKLAEDMGL